MTYDIRQVNANMPKVAIVKGTDPIQQTVQALAMINSDVDVVLSEKKPILVKPNYLNSKAPSTGITTDGRVVEGVVKFLKEKGQDVVIGEGSGFGETFHAFRVAGVDTVAERYGVRLVDLNSDEFVEVHPPNALSLKKVKVAKTAVESVIVSVPKLKLHRIAGVTLSLKNMMGALATKGVMHAGFSLSENIADLASVLTPSVAVVDGIIAGEGHENSGNPVEMNLVIAGTDPVAVDSVGAAIMGVVPADVKHLVLAQKKGLGTCSLEQITILGEPIEKVKRKFRKSFSSRLLAHIG